MKRKINDEFGKSKDELIELGIKYCNEIRSGIRFTIHGNTCYMLNFCGLTQEEATEMSEHYNRINEIVTAYRKDLEAMKNHKEES